MPWNRRSLHLKQPRQRFPCFAFHHMRKRAGIQRRLLVPHTQFARRAAAPNAQNWQPDTPTLKFPPRPSASLCESLPRFDPSPAESRRRKRCVVATAHHTRSDQLHPGFDRPFDPQSAALPHSHEQRALANSPCMCSRRVDPARSCRSSTFCVHRKKRSLNRDSNSASATCAGFGSAFAPCARRCE